MKVTETVAAPCVGDDLMKRGRRVLRNPVRWAETELKPQREPWLLLNLGSSRLGRYWPDFCVPSRRICQDIDQSHERDSQQDYRGRQAGVRHRSFSGGQRAIGGDACAGEFEKQAA